MASEKTEPMNVRTPVDLKKALIKAANGRGLNLTQLVVMILTRWVKDNGK